MKKNYSFIASGITKLNVNLDSETLEIISNFGTRNFLLADIVAVEIPLENNLHKQSPESSNIVSSMNPVLPPGIGKVYENVMITQRLIIILKGKGKGNKDKLIAHTIFIPKSGSVRDELLEDLQKKIGNRLHVEERTDKEINKLYNIEPSLLTKIVGLPMLFLIVLLVICCWFSILLFRSDSEAFFNLVEPILKLIQ